jgi:hypothetical protein
MGQEVQSNLEDLAHERVIWKLQHFAWGLFALIGVAAVAGVFGSGPAARAKAQNASLSVEYERFLRYQASSTLKLHVSDGAGSALPAVWLAKDFVDNLEIERIYPAPEQVKVGPDRFIYVFNVAQTNGTVTIAFHFKPDGYGRTRGRVGLVGGSEVGFEQFVYP